MWLAFAADFATGIGCGDEPTGGSGGSVGCDIYRARLHPTTFAPVLVERLTSDPAVEVFPSIAPGGGRVAFHTLEANQGRSLGVVEAAGLRRTLVLRGAQYPSFLPDGVRFVYTDVAAGNVLTLGTLAATGTSVTTTSALSSLKPAQDAEVARDGSRLVFHVTGTGAGHGVYVLEVTTGVTTLITQQSGIGHCTLWSSSTPSSSNARVVCDDASGRGLYGWTLSAGVVSGPTLIVADPASIASEDGDYAGCGFASVDFPSFCDETHLAVSVSCVTAATGVLFSKVYLADLATTPGTLRPLGVQLAAWFAGPGRRSWTPSCRFEP